MTASLSVLGALRVNAIMQGLQDVRQLPQQLVWSARIPDQAADDDEIMARFTGYVQIADLVADDQEAVTYNSGKMTYESLAVPNIKIGISLTQKQLNQLYALKTRGGDTRDEAGVLDFETRNLNAIDLGIKQRCEALRIAMLCDGLNYNRLGIKMNNVTWGMPADMKITVGTPWDNVNATPVNDVLTAKRTAQVRYGMNLNRLSLSLTAFLYAIATTEFQNKAKLFLPAPLTFANLNLADTESMKNLAQNVMGVQIEFSDARVWSQKTDGTVEQFALQPITKAILSSTETDGDRQCWDFADGIVTESIVNELVPTEINGNFSGPMRGTVAYTSAEHNPPRVTYWGVKRGFPRRHMLQANACLTVGSFVDLIPVGEPY